MINERKLSKSELKKREDIIMKMKGNKRDLVKKYGKDAEAVMYGRATNMAKKKTENMRDPKITELIKDALKNPKKADLDKDGKLSDYEKTRGAAIEKSMAKEDYDGGDLESGQYGDPKVGNYDITSQNDNEASDIEALSAAGLEEDIDIGHEDNEPGMLQGDLYEIGKASMEIYAMLDDMEGQGEVDLPSWWQSKVYKAKEAIVGAAEYLDFELKEPAIDAVVDKVAPLDINVDPLGETVEDYITSVDDLTEVELPSSLLTKINAEVKDAKTMAKLMVNLYNAIQDKEASDFSKNQKFGRALGILIDLKDDEVEDEDSNTVDEGVINEGAFDVVKKKLLGFKDKIVNKIGDSSIEKFKVAIKKALGSNTIKLSDINLDNAKKVADELKGVSLQEGIFDAFKSRVYNDTDPDNDEEGVKDLLKKLGMGAGLIGVIAAVGPTIFFGLLALIAVVGASGALDEGEVEEMSNADSNYGSNDGSNENSNDNPESYSGLKKFVAEKLAKDLKEGLPKGFFDKAMKAKDEVDESFDSLAKKLDKQKGVDKEYAGKIAGKIANIKRKGGGSGPTAKQKKRMSEDYDSLVSKLKKQGKSAKAAGAIAGAMASYKAKGGGKGPTAKQKKRAK